MATTAQTFWPDPAYTPHDQAYGTDIDALLETSPAVSSTTTRNNHGTGGEQTITFDPNTTRSTAGSVDTFGWAVQEASMDSQATARRLIRAGDWTFTVQMTGSATGLNACFLSVQVYRVAAAPSFTRTSLGTAEINFGLPLPVGGVQDIVVTLPEIVLAADETIQYTLRSRMPGQLFGIEVFLNLNSTTRVVLPAPGILTIYRRSLPATLVGVAATPVRYIRLTAKTATLLGVAVANRTITAFRTFSSTLLGATPEARKTVRPAAKTATLTGVAPDPVKYVRLAAKTATLTGVTPDPVKYVRLAAKTATLLGVATVNRTITAFRSFSETLVGVPTLARSVIAVRSFLATMVGRSRGDVKIDITVLDRMTGGPTPAPIIRKQVNVFDD